MLIRTSKLAAAALAVPLLLTALTACGADDETPAADGGEGTSSTQTFDDYQLALAECLRDQGVDMPDPDEDGSIAMQQGDGMIEAAEACRTELGEPPADPDAGPVKSDEEQRAEWIEIAGCFREKGYDTPDPGPGESLSVPLDAPDEVFEECAPQGIGGSTSAGGN